MDDIECGLRILRKAIIEADEQAADEAAEAYADAHANDDCAPVTTADIAKAISDTPPSTSAIIAAYNVAVVDMVAKACGLPSL